MRCLVPVAAVLLAACLPTTRVASSLNANEAAFVPVRCLSMLYRRGAGSRGVELEDASGRRLRLIVGPDEGTTVIAFAPGTRRGTTMPSCGDLSLRTNGWSHNGVVELSGDGTLDCHAEGWNVVGKVTFTGCTYQEGVEPLGPG